MIPENKTRKTIQTLTVRETSPLAEGVYSLTLEYPEGMAPETVRPGQFVGIYTNDAARLLPRPISVCGWDAGRRRLRLVYRIAGAGTAQFSQLSAGDAVRVLGMLGNGYDVPALAGKRVLLLGGGIGAPPMLGLAQALQAVNSKETTAIPPEGGGPCGTDSAAADRHLPDEPVTSVMGYRTNDLFLTEEFAAAGRLVISTDDGSCGFRGNAVEAARTLIPEKGPCPFDVICACGPLPMLRSVRELAGDLGIPAYLSLEERMACGVGACLGCVTKTVQVDGHSRVRNARICTEGPVFRADEVVL